MTTNGNQNNANGGSAAGGAIGGVILLLILLFFGHKLFNSWWDSNTETGTTTFTDTTDPSTGGSDYGFTDEHGNSVRCHSNKDMSVRTCDGTGVYK